MIIPIKVKQAIKQFLFRNKSFNKNLDIDSFKKIRKSIDVRDPFIPLSGNYRLNVFEPLELDKFNSEMDMLTIDSKTISEATQTLMQEVKDRILYNEVTKVAFKNKQQKIIKDGVFLVSNQFIEGLTTNIDFKKDFVNTDNDIEIDYHFIKLKTVGEEIVKENYTSEAVSITVDKYLGQIGNNFEPEIIGNKAALIDSSFGNELSVIVKSVLVETITIKIRINLNVKNVNNITVFFPDPDFGQFVNISVNKLGNENEEVYANLNKADRITATFPVTDIRYIIISISQKLPNYTVAGVNVYKFDIKKVKVSNTQRKLTGSIISNKLAIKEDTQYLSFITEETIPKKCSIEYLISNNVNDLGQPINFFKVTPVTRTGQNIKENFIKIGTKKYTQIIEQNTQNNNATDWSFINVDKTFGGKLYPIFDLSLVSEIQGLVIDESTAKLYRGINDWSVLRSKIQNEKKYEKIYYLPPFDSTEKKYINQPIYITQDDEVIITADNIVTGGMKIEVTYLPEITLDKNFKDKDFNQVNFNIIDYGTGIPNSNNKYEIKIDTIDSTRYGKYSFKYHYNIDLVTGKKISIKKNETILYNSNGSSLDQGLDYQIIDDTNSKRIEFLRNGNYRGQNLLLDVVVIEETFTEYTTYKCVVTVSNNITLEIKPFTRKETESGCFHKINGENVSTRNSFDLNIGTYIIETTQPFPGFNQFTNELTTASIIIPFELVEMKGYEESLRKVPIYELSLNSGTDDRQFGIANNKVYLNRKPDYLTAITERSEGKYMKCIRMDEDGIPIHIPEKFKLEFSYNDGTKSSILYLTVKLDRNPESEATPIIEKIGFNEFNVELF